MHYHQTIMEKTMKNNFKKVIKFFLEMVITLLPFIVIYSLFCNWLSRANDIGRFYEKPWNPKIKYVYIEFDTFGENFVNYQIDVQELYWIVLISAISLIIIGKLIHLCGLKIIKNRKDLKGGNP